MKINNMVELSPRVLEQYHCLRYNEVFPRDITPPQSTDVFPGEQFMLNTVPTTSSLPPTDAYHDCMAHIECDTTLQLNMILQWLN